VPLIWNRRPCEQRMYPRKRAESGLIRTVFEQRGVKAAHWVDSASHA